MSAATTQIRCPFCNAPSAAAPGERTTCEFCLQPFAVEDAQREQLRLNDEIRAWVEQRVGAAAVGGSGVDAASRSYLFQSKILPDLKREVDRALECVGGYAQHPLLGLPVRAPTRGALGIHPLRMQRAHVLGLKGLRARLAAETVSAFAQTDGDRRSLARLDEDLGTLFTLSNVVEASDSRTGAGYAAARRNLTELASGVEATLARAGAKDAAHAAYLGALVSRYRALADLAELVETLTTATAAPGFAESADRIAAGLEQAAFAAQASNHSPMESMSTVIGIQHEAASARALAAWLRAFEALAARSPVTFAAFVADLDPFTGGGHLTPDEQLGLVDAVAFGVRAARGEVSLPLLDDFSWVDGWAEQGKQKRSLGMFGADERVAEVQTFLTPVWVVDVSYSVTSGTVFTLGRETRTIALVEACAPTPSKVAILDATHATLAQALSVSSLVAPGARPVALVRSSAHAAFRAVEHALRSRPGVVSPRASVRGLALVASASAVFTGGAVARTATACLAGHVAVDEIARGQVAAMGQVLAHYP